MTKLRVKRAELRFLRHQLEELEAALNPRSLKAFVVAGLELYLSFALVLSLFECPDPQRRDAMELRYLSRVAWMPLAWGAVLAFGHKLAPSVAPRPEHLDRNVRISKYLVWLYTLGYLIWDRDMVLKQGPALQVAVLFCVCDLARFEIECLRLIDDDAEEEEEEEMAQLARALEAAGHDPAMALGGTTTTTVTNAPPAGDVASIATVTTHHGRKDPRAGGRGQQEACKPPVQQPHHKPPPHGRPQGSHHHQQQKRPHAPPPATTSTTNRRPFDRDDSTSGRGEPYQEYDADTPGATTAHGGRRDIV